MTKWLGFQISYPIQNPDHLQPNLSDDSKSRLVQISDLHCSTTYYDQLVLLLLSMFLFTFQNYLVVVEPDSVTKYGLVQGKHGHERLSLPPSKKCGTIRQLSATPRHLLAVTTDGGKVEI